MSLRTIDLTRLIFLLTAGLLAGLMGLTGCGSGGGGDSALTPDPVEPTVENPYSARFHVDVATGEVTSAASSDAVGTSAVLTGTAVGFSATRLVDEDGGVGVKATAVRVTNRTGRSLKNARVVFSEFTNVSAWSDIRSQVNVNTLASTASDPPSGTTVGADGAVYATAGHRVLKIVGSSSSVFAGGTLSGYLEGVGEAARFSSPIGIAVNPTDGSLVVAESSGRRIRRIDSGGSTSLIAGTGASGGTNGLGTAATFSTPSGVAVTSGGIIYVSEAGGHRIRKITKTGSDPTAPGSYTVATLAGSGSASYVDGTGTGAGFNTPRGVAVDAAGNVYVTDTSNRRIRMIRPNGQTVTIAGSGAFGAVDGAGDAASFSSPYGIAVLPDAGQGIALAVSDNSWLLRQVRIKDWGTGSPTSPSGWVVQTLAGAYTSPGSSDGDGSVARFNGPRLLGSDANGNVYVADNANSAIRRVAPNNGFFPVGDVTTAPLPEPVRMANVDGYFPWAGGEDRPLLEYGDIAAGATSSARNWSFAVPDGVTAFEFSVTVEGLAEPYAPAAGGTGGGSTRVMMTTLAGSTTGVNGYVDGMGNNARFRCVVGIALDDEGNAYVCDSENNAVRRIGTDGRTTTVAGSAGSGGYADGLGNVAKLNYPSGIAYIGGDNLSEPTSWPTGTEGFHLIVTDLDNYCVRIIRCPYNTYSGSTPWELWNPAFYQVDTIAGDGTRGYVNGTGDTARFYAPSAVAVGPGGVVYVCERTGGSRVRALRWLGGDPLTPTNWQVELLAGAIDGSSGYVDATGSSARFDDPRGITVGPDGNVYVTDTYNHCIRKITPDGAVTTLAGTNTSGYVDAVGSAARFYRPWDIAAGPDGHLYVADRYNYRIRRVTLGGAVTTVAGTGSATRSDGRGDAVGLQDDLGIGVSAGGDLYVGEAECMRLIQRIVDVGGNLAAAP